MFTFRRSHRLARLASAAAAIASVGALVASPAQAKDPVVPQATPLEKVSNVVQPSIVYIGITYSGFLVDQEGQPITKEPVKASFSCTGFIVNPDGFIGSAGHCFDDAKGRDALYDVMAAELYQQDPRFEQQGITPQQLADQLRANYSVAGFNRDVDVAYGVDVSGLKNAKALPARVLARTDFNAGDVALIKIEGQDLPALQLAPDTQVEVGMDVVSIGYPGSVNRAVDLSLNPSFKDGAISSKKTIGNGLRSVFEVSAAVSHGMSGGPTVDLQGRVVGVNSFGPADESQSFNFISPASEIARMMAEQGVRNDVGSINRTYRAGLAAYYAGDRAAALASFNRVLDLQPSHELAHTFRVKALELPVAKQDDGLSVGLIAAIAGGALALGLLALVTLRRRRGLPPVPGMATPVAPVDPTLEARAFVTVQDGPLAERRFPIATETVIGRDHADINVDDPQVSRRHAALRPIEGGLEIEDLGSANGTKVNGTTIAGSRRLRQGDVVEVGRIRLIAEVTEPRRQDTLLPGVRRDALLVVKDGPLVGRQFPVSAEVLIGREQADVVLDDVQVSRRHALVRPVRGGLEIEDLRSANGTRVNGERVETTRRLQDGDQIRIGRINLEVQVSAASRNGNGHGSIDPRATVLGAER